MSLVVKKATKEFCKTKGVRCPDRVLVALSARIESMLTDAAKRASGNNRKTLKESDL